MSVRPLSSELAAKAKEELGEDPARIPGDIQHIKDWIAKQPHLRARTDDQWILSFLRGCKFSLEKTKQKIDLFYTMYTLAPELCGKINMDDPLFDEIVDLCLPFPMIKSKDPTKPRLMIMNPKPFDPSKFKITESMKISRLINLILMMEDDQVMVSGLEYVMDMENMTMGHMTQMTPTLMKKMALLAQEASPFRQKGFHYLNTPTGFETIFNLMKGFLNEKINRRLHVHNKNFEGLLEHIPKEELLKEYGGEGPTRDELRDHWKKKLLEYRDFFEQEWTFGTDESKRQGAPKTGDNLFGIEGSFRQLAVD